LEKIVIRTDQAEPDAHLLSLLSRIFPECEIHIVTHGEDKVSHDWADGCQTEFKEEKHG
jgi:hypothetical protein